MARTVEKIQEEINTFETRLKSAFEYLKDMEQYAQTHGKPVAENEQYTKIKSQIPKVEDRLRTLYAELECAGGKPPSAAPEPKPAPAPAVKPAPPAPKAAPPQQPAHPQPVHHPHAPIYPNVQHYSHQPHSPHQPHPPHAPHNAPFIQTVPMDANMSATTTMGLSAESLTKRGFALLEDEEWIKAHEKFDSALDIDMEFARAYIGLLCTELRITNEKKLANQNTLLTEHKYFNKALRYADRDYRVMLETFNHIIEHRLEDQQAGQAAPTPQAPAPVQPQPAPRPQPQAPAAQAPAPPPQAPAPAPAPQAFVPEVEQRKPDRPAGPLTEEQKLQLRQAERQRKDELENAQIEEEQQYRKNQREWMKKGLCFYCGGKMTLMKKCKSCGKTNF